VLGWSLLDDPFEKIDADGLFVVPGEDAFAEALDHAGLANGTVAHNHHLSHKRIKERKEEEKWIEENSLLLIF